MHYAILTTPGVSPPFDYRNTAPPTAPGDSLRVAPNATLIAFVNQPDLVLGSRWANASGKLLYHVPETILHPDDLAEVEEFASQFDFQRWLWDQERQ